MDDERGQKTVTDWAGFYKNQGTARKLSALLGIRSILRSLVRNARSRLKIIIELGGANTPFYEPLRKRYPEAEIITLDREANTDTKYLQKTSGDIHLQRITIDILQDSLPEHLIGCSDCVLSTGLIEHFSPENKAKMIRRHLEWCRPGALCL